MSLWTEGQLFVRKFRISYPKYDFFFEYMRASIKFVEYSDTSANEDNSFRNHIR